MSSSWYKDYGYLKFQQKHFSNAIDIIKEMRTVVQKLLTWK